MTTAEVSSTSIFPELTLDRSKSQWDDFLYKLTPVEEHQGVWFKREDYFAPLGYGGINGSKLRQLIWLFQGRRESGVVSGAVRQSPQHVMVAAVAKHFGMDCIQYAGGTEGGGDKEVLQMAAGLGAEIRYVTPGYAATLNSKALHCATDNGWLHIETNITRERQHNLPLEIEAFHRVGSEQVRNLPDEIETLILPAGSCNSAASVLYGIARFRPPRLKTIVLMGIGSKGSKDPNYVFDRLQTVLDGSSLNPVKARDLFDPLFVHNPGLEKWFNPRAPYKVVHYNLNGTGFCKYEEMMPYTFAGIQMHPRYEGKIWNYMKNVIGMPESKVLFWIVGSAPQKKVMERYYD